MTLVTPGGELIAIQPQGLIQGAKPVFDTDWEGIRAYGFTAANSDFQIFVAQSRDALHLKQALFLVEGTTAIASIRAAGAAKRALLMGSETLPMSELATGALTANGYSVSRGGQEYLRGAFTGRFRRNEVEISASAEVSVPVVALVAFALVSGGMSAS